MIFTDRIITVRKGESKINEPIIVYRGDYELEVRFTIMNSKFKFMSGTNLIESENAAYGQLAILTPYGGNIFSEVAKCNEGTVTFVLTKEMLDQIEEVGLYSFQIRLFDYNKESRVSIPPVEFGIEVREPITSEDHDNSVNNAIVGYSIAKIADALNEEVPDTFNSYGDYNKTIWETGDRITEGKLNKIEDAIDTINDDAAALDKRITSNFNVLNSTKADKNEIFSMANMGQDVKEAMTGGSVAVVGKNTVLTENIVDNQITPMTTNFFDIVNFMSLGNLQFVNAYPSLEGNITSSNTGVSMILKVEENTDYILKFTNIDINRSNTVGSAENDFTLGSTHAILVNSFEAETLCFSTTSGMSWVCVYIYNGSDYTIEDFEANKTNIALYKNEIPLNENDTIKENFLPKDILYKTDKLSSYIGNNEITPNKTTFFESKNLLFLNGYTLVNATSNTDGMYQQDSNALSIIYAVDPNKTYIVQLPELANRRYFISNTNSEFIIGETYAVLNASVIDDANNIYTFTTNADTYYVLSYIYNGSSPEDVNMSEYKLVEEFEHLNYCDEYISTGVLPNEILYKSDNISYYIPKNTIIPEKTTFFINPDLLSFNECSTIAGTFNTAGLYSSAGSGISFVFPVEPNTDYAIKMPVGTNRHYFLGNTSNTFVSGNTYPVLDATTVEENEIYTFTTNSDTKYVSAYFYYGTDSSIIDVNEFKLSSSVDDLNKDIYIDNKYLNVDITQSYYGKKVLTMGDSITAINEGSSNWERSWRKYFKEVVNPSKLSNTAVPGATWRDKDGTIYDGNPVINGEDNNVNNVMGNQLEILLRARDVSHPNYSQNLEYDDDFDMIIIACGTNDKEHIIPTAEEIETQFHNESTPISDLDVLDRTSWAGAMRYVIDNLRMLYPNALIYVCTPIQRTGNNYQVILDKNTIIKDIARRLSVNLIDTMVCGVYDMTCPSMGQEGDFNDGLHLSPQGASKMGKFIANEIKNRFY